MATLKLTSHVCNKATFRKTLSIPVCFEIAFVRLRFALMTFGTIPADTRSE